MICLIPAGGGTPFFFTPLPEQVEVKYGAKYQTFDTISHGTVKVPRGTDVTEVSWSGEFFGFPRRNETIVNRMFWMLPAAARSIIEEYVDNETVLTLIITDIWLNIDVTISSFHTTGYGAFGNLKYDISFAQKKPLEIYTTDELNTDSYVKKTNPRTDLAAASTGSGQSYTVSSGDSLWKIAQKQYGDGSKWKKIYDANKDTIEAAAKKHGKKSSDSGKWIYPGASLIIP